MVFSNPIEYDKIELLTKDLHVTQFLIFLLQCPEAVVHLNQKTYQK